MTEDEIRRTEPHATVADAIYHALAPFVGFRIQLDGDGLPAEKWWDEPDAVVTYAAEPSPETGHAGWIWWACGRMGEAPTRDAAMCAAVVVVERVARQ